MSKQESSFIKWFGTIAAALIVATITGLIGMYRASGILSEKVNANEAKIIQIRKYHDKDVSLIRSNISDMRSNQKIIMNDEKQILKQIK
jgi:hypothetical protein